MGLDLAEDCGDDYVPKDYKELYLGFGAFVAKLLSKKNRVKTNAQQEDLISHTWCELLRVKILEKYNASSVFPRTLTGEQAAKFCGVTFDRWKVMIWRGAKGDMRKKTKGDTTRTCRQGVPRPIRGGWSSRKAVYLSTEVIALYDSGAFRPGGKMVEERIVPSARTRFRAYLGISVGNIFKNFLRTKSRKEKDLYLDPMEDGTPWEATLTDAFQPSPETNLEVMRIVEEVEIFESGDRDKISNHLVEKGCTMAEVRRRVDIFNSVLGRHKEEEGES